ncbi:MAG: hypothetical protein HBSAPP03_16820 [Phycisphaerae bacterium]|nr:MAG: hypothetical protein HBSAPP03_16820 [Phycisphaerae bacterium]
MANLLLMIYDALHRESLAGYLQLRGHGVRSLGVSTSGNATPTFQKPDALIIDMDLQNDEAFRLLRGRLANPGLSKVPVIALANPRDRNDVATLASFGVRHIVLKSTFTMDALEQKICTCCAEASAPVPVCPDNLPPSPSGPIMVTHVSAAEPASPEHRPARTQPEAVQIKSRAALKDMPPLVSPDELRGIIAKAGELHALSPAVTRVSQMAGRAEVPADEIAKVIKQDPAIAMKVLKLANSTVYSRGAPVDSVLLAVRRIGMEQIRQAVLNIAIVDGFANSGQPQILNMHLFWEHSIAVGLFTAAIMGATGGAPAEIDAAFTMGLLHDAGRVILAEHLGDRYARVIEIAQSLELPLETVEKRLIGLNHAELMEKLLVSWRFAGSLVKPVVLHHASISAIQQHAPGSMKACFAVALADGLAHAMMLGDSVGETIAPLGDLIAALHLKEDALRTITETVPPQVQDLKVAMLASAPPGGAWPDRAKAALRRLPEGFRPVYVGPNRAAEPACTLAEALRRAGSGERPTVAIVAAETPDEAAAANAALEAMDREAGTAVPAIVLRWTGGESASVLPGRTSVELRGPFQFETFCRAARDVLKAA